MNHSEMYLYYFSENEEFPFFIQYGHHDEDMFLHSHADFTELAIILGGSAVHMVKDEEYTVKRGDAFVIGDNTAHAYHSPNHFRLCNIMFRPDYFFPNHLDVKQFPGFHALFVIEPALTQQKGFHSKLTLNNDTFGKINSMITELHHEFHAHSIGYQTMINALFLQLITELSRYYEATDAPDMRSDTSLAGSVAFIENHFREELSLDELSEMAGMSTRHFRRIFHDIYGTSPIKYINTLRIQAAIRLLQTTGLSVTEIAMRVGYSDGNYFSSKFHQATGCSPREYRKRNTP